MTGGGGGSGGDGGALRQPPYHPTSNDSDDDNDCQQECQQQDCQQQQPLTRRRPRLPLCRRLLRVVRYTSLLLTSLSALGSVLAQDDVSPQCDQLFESSADNKKGTFETPDYPAAYPSNLNCLYRFRAGKGEVVWVQWDTFHLREPLNRNNQCLYDYVEIVITDQQQQQHVSGRYCGNRTPPNLETMQHMMDIRFHSQNSQGHAGFRATYLFLDEQQVPPPQSKYNASALSTDLQAACGGMTKERYSGTITSPGYPHMYPAHVECNWLIRVQANKQIYVKLQDLQFSNTMQCNDAALYIIDGYKHSTLLNMEQAKDPSSAVRLCGNILYQGTDGSRGYMSDQNRMIIKFISRREPHASDYNEMGMVGFRLTWTEVTVAETPTDCQSNEFLCSGGEYCIDEGGSVCAKGKQYCVHKSLVCNGAPNCAEHDDSDEENCYAIQIVIAGALVVALLVFVIFTVVCCQRRRNRAQLSRMKQRHVQSHTQHNHQDSAMTHLSAASAVHHPPQNTGETLRAQSNITDASDARGVLNRHNPQQHATSPNHTPAAATANRQSLDLRAMPANYHGYNLPPAAAQTTTPHNIRQRRQLGTESDDDEHRPFLVNHVSSGGGSGGHSRKPLRVPVPPEVHEPTGFIQAHAEPVHVWEVKPQQPASTQRRAASAQPPSVTVRQTHQLRQLGGSNRQSSVETDFGSMCTPPLVEVHQHHPHPHHHQQQQQHQQQRGLVPADDVLFDDQLRLTTSASSSRRQPSSTTKSPRQSLMHNHHQPSEGKSHVTAFARPLLSSTSGTPVNSASGRSNSSRDSPSQGQHNPPPPPVRKRVGFADSVEEQTVDEDDDDSSTTGGGGAGGGAPRPPRYEDACDSAADNADTPPISRGVSPWRHHKSAIV